MTHRERFQRIYHFLPVDRIPIYYFGTWFETKSRWMVEGCSMIKDPNTYFGPQLPGMDPDWEDGMWNAQGLVNVNAIGDMEPCILEDKGDTVVRRSAIGEIMLERKDGGTIPHTLSYGLEPTHASWDRFKSFLDPTDGKRYPPHWRSKAESLNSTDKVTSFMGGSLYGWLRGWMGVENISYLMYDDPALLEEMVAYLSDYFMTLMEPVLKITNFDFVYFFEDCCGSHGPLFSPEKYGEIFGEHYRRMLKFYKNADVPLALIDSDGYTEPLIPCWLNSGFDIIFPIEVGKWGANPKDLRRKFGHGLCMLGGVDKAFLYGPEHFLRDHLTLLKESVVEGGFIPIPDHRIPPQVSLEQMLRYIDIFTEVMNG